MQHFNYSSMRVPNVFVDITGPQESLGIIELGLSTLAMRTFSAILSLKVGLGHASGITICGTHGHRTPLHTCITIPLPQSHSRGDNSGRGKYIY